MKFKDTQDFRQNRPYDIEDCLDSLMQGYSDSGSIEKIEADLYAVRVVLAKFMAQHVTTLAELNSLAGFGRFEEFRGFRG